LRLIRQTFGNFTYANYCRKFGEGVWTVPYVVMKRVYDCAKLICRHWWFDYVNSFNIENCYRYKEEFPDPLQLYTFCEVRRRQEKSIYTMREIVPLTDRVFKCLEWYVSKDLPVYYVVDKFGDTDEMRNSSFRLHGKKISSKVDGFFSELGSYMMFRKWFRDQVSFSDQSLYSNAIMAMSPEKKKFYYKVEKDGVFFEDDVLDSLIEEIRSYEDRID